MAGVGKRAGCSERCQQACEIVCRKWVSKHHAKAFAQAIDDCEVANECCTDAGCTCTTYNCACTESSGTCYTVLATAELIGKTPASLLSGALAERFGYAGVFCSSFVASAAWLGAVTSK